MSRFARYLAALITLNLAACAVAPPLPTPIPGGLVATALPPTTTLPASPTARLMPTRAPPSPTIPPPTATPSIIPSPTAASITFASPTPVPPFPYERLTTESITRLRQLRQLGYGRAERVIFAPGRRLIAIITSAGVLYTELPSLRPLRFASGVHDLAFTPDNYYVATVTENLTAIRRLDNGTILRTIPGSSPRFSADGRMIAVADSNNTVVYQLSSSPPLLALAGDEAAFSPDSRTIAVARRGTITLHRLSDGAVLQNIPGNSPRFSPTGELMADGNFSFSADGRQMIYLEDNRVVTRDLASGSEQHRPAGASAGAIVSLSPTGSMLMERRETGRFLVTHIADGKKIIEADSGELFFSPDDRFAVLLDSNSEMARLIRLSDGIPMAELNLPGYNYVVFSPDGRTMAAGGDNVDLIRIVDGTPLASLNTDAFAVGWEHERSMLGLAFDPTGRQVYVAEGFAVSGSRGAKLSAWDMASGTQGWLTEAPGASGETFGIAAFHPATGAIASFDFDRRLIIQSGDGIIQMLTTPLPAEHRFPWIFPATVAFNPAGNLLVMGTAKGSVQLFSTGDYRLKARFDAGGPVAALAFSPDGSLLGARRTDGKLIIWPLDSSLTETTPFTINTPPVTENNGFNLLSSHFIFSADNQLLFALTPDAINIYRVTDGHYLHTISGTADTIAVGPAGMLLAVVSKGQVTLWGVGGL